MTPHPQSYGTQDKDREFAHRLLRWLRPCLLEAVVGAVLAAIIVFVVFSAQSKLAFVYQGF